MAGDSAATAYGCWGGLPDLTDRQAMAFHPKPGSGLECITTSVAEDALAGTRASHDGAGGTFTITPSRTAVYESEEGGRRIMGLTGHTDYQSKCIRLAREGETGAGFFPGRGVIRRLGNGNMLGT